MADDIHPFIRIEFGMEGNDKGTKQGRCPFYECKLFITASMFAPLIPHPSQEHDTRMKFTLYYPRMMMLLQNG